MERSALRIAACFDGSFLELQLQDGAPTARLGHVAIDTCPGTEGYTPIADAIIALFGDLGANTTTVDISPDGAITMATAPVSFNLAGEGVTSPSVIASYAWLGFDLPLSGAGPHVASRPMNGLLFPKYPVKTGGSSDWYQPDKMWTEAEADDGTAYAVGRVTAPTYEDFKIGFESREKTHPKWASLESPVPWTFGDFIDLVGAAHPFVVTGDTWITAHKMRAGAARFRPIREVEEFDQYWHWPFETRVLGSRLAKDTPNIIFGAALSEWYQPGDWTLAAGSITRWRNSVDGGTDLVLGQGAPQPGSLLGLDGARCSVSRLESEAPQPIDAPCLVAYVQSISASSRVHVGVHADWQVGGGSAHLRGQLPGTALLTDAGATNDAPRVWMTWRDASGAYAETQGRQISAAPDALAGSSVLSIGGAVGGAASGTLDVTAEIVVVRGAQVSPAQRARLYTYFSEKYGAI